MTVARAGPEARRQGYPLKEAWMRVAGGAGGRRRRPRQEEVDEAERNGAGREPRLGPRR